MPANTVYVGRPSKWGNPYAIGEREICPIYLLRIYPTPIGWRKIRITEENCLKLFELYVSLKLSVNAKWLDPLYGKDLACWCRKDQKCHADVLLKRIKHDQKIASRIANSSSSCRG